MSRQPFVPVGELGAGVVSASLCRNERAVGALPSSGRSIITYRMSVPLVVWTVGHSNQELDEFAQLVVSEHIEFLVDVRSLPYSRFARQFNREHLQACIAERGVRYLFLGEELGGRPSRDEHYDADGHALYSRMAEEQSFRAAIDRLVAGADRHRIAIVCSEADPEHCHRRLLVGKVLTERGVELRHILPGGAVQVEHSVDLAEHNQNSLFDEEETPWRSARSVSYRRRLAADATS